MSRLDDLQRSISSMTVEELHAFHRSIRSDRKIKKASKVKAAGKKATDKDKAKALIEKMTPEQRLELVKRLKG